MPDDRNQLENLKTPDEASLARPGYPRATGYPDAYTYGYPEPGGNKINLKEIWRTLKKHKWLVAVIALVVTTIVAIVSFQDKSIYQASATIEIEPENRTLVRSGDVVIQTEDSGDDAYFDTINMKTKIRVLQSRPILEEVVATLNLDKNPRFLDVNGKKSIWDALRSITAKFHGASGPRSVSLPPPVLKQSGPRSAEESARLAPYVALLAAHLSADTLEDTRMLVVSFSHTDPDLAASIANTTAQVFIDKSFQNSTETYTKTSAWLDQMTRQLQGRVETAEQKLADYTREHNMFSTDGKESLSSEKLSRLFDQATRAETDRMLKQSLYEQVKAGKIDQLPEAFTDARTADLQKRAGELSVELAQYNVKFGEDNPRIVELKQEIAEVNQQIEAGRAQLEAKLKADYDRAVQDEQSLKAALEAAKGEAVQQNEAAIQYNILKQEVDTSKQLYTDFLQKTSQANVQVAEQHNNMRVVEPADVPGAPIAPNRARTILMGFFLSLVGGLGIAFGLEYFDNTIKTIEDVNRYAQLPALGVIPAISSRLPRRLLSRNRPRPVLAPEELKKAQEGKDSSAIQLVALDAKSGAAEAYRGLRTSVLLSSAGGPPKSVMFTSSQPAEGKTTTAINTAISLAQLGSSVVIIDCDLRKPGTHKVFGVAHDTGLSTYLSGENVPLDSVIRELPVPHLSLIPCGPIPPNPAELVSSDKMRELVRTLGERYDHVIVDSPPLMHVTDPIILATLVDGVILVVHGGKSTRDAIRRARLELSGVGAKVFGVVLNNLDLKREGYDDYYYYSYYSGYGENSEGH